MSQEKREIVIPSQLLGDVKNKKAGRGTFVENGKIYAEVLGILNKNSNYINITPLKGRYDPIEKDFVIGIVEEAMASSWLVDINAAYPALLHVNEVPWDVDFGETERYLNHGDSIMAKVLQVDQEKKLQITLKDRNLYKIKGGQIIDIEPSKVPRIIGKKGSMVSILKKYTKCRIFVGQNGRIWVDGDDDGVKKVIDTIKMIEEEALSYGLTNKIEELLKKDAKDVH
jgi:exosome complex component RRP4